MGMQHAVVWVDHAQAHVIHFNTEASAVQKVGGSHPHLHHKSGATGSGHAAPAHVLYRDVLSALGDAGEVLIVGPGSAKQELSRFAADQPGGWTQRIVGVETVDHPSDAQLLAYARKYFLHADRMR